MRYWAVMAGAALVLATPALADEWDFVLTNDTGKEIKTIALSPTGANQWQANKVAADIQKTGPIKPAGRSTIHFEKSADQCKFDVRATFSDDTTQIWTAINVCDDSYVTLRIRNGAPVFAAN